MIRQVKWVSECYTFLNVIPATRFNGDQRKQFLNHMSKQHEEWQVKQTDVALRLYYYFLSCEIKANAGGPPASDGEKSVDKLLRDWYILPQEPGSDSRGERPCKSASVWSGSW